MSTATVDVELQCFPQTYLHTWTKLSRFFWPESHELE